MDAKQRFGPFTMGKRPVTMYLLKKKKRFDSFFLNDRIGHTGSFMTAREAKRYSISNEIHQTLMTRFYLYNAFDLVFK